MHVSEYIFVFYVSECLQSRTVSSRLFWSHGRHIQAPNSPYVGNTVVDKNKCPMTLPKCMLLQRPGTLTQHGYSEKQY